MQDNTYMVMLTILENSVINDDVAGFRNEAFFSFVVLYLNITLRKFFPGDTACQMAGFAFIRPDRYLKSRFQAAIIDKCRAP